MAKSARNEITRTCEKSWRGRIWDRKRLERCPGAVKPGSLRTLGAALKGRSCTAIPTVAANPIIPVLRAFIEVLSRAAKDLCAVKAGDARNCGDHHAR